ncbi:General transcription factor 3C polypeptide 6 [Amphibalanus amphitrite]|uniref:General transcription factor 3C polypeptide 6 n=1 Tax=Amphibalanus amphitrite TaxID=1232801 RepID=A0A6A4WNQ9_AMPAM|nr:general transcription factor 3C polypeptide 6-like [Amphibalanus amphitrite]XP_043195345.1 general transcription factor 3C polypeptide 6-like [Amphibalanus amphitrite]KAF0304272.1 General transcription factor 3C polypeptide 6 [Amphibalanus amphitrite]
MESGDSEYEEEEMVVLVELHGLVDDELLTKGCSYQFVGIDTDKPVLQLGKYNFLGHYEDQIGSALFLGQSTDDGGQKTWSKVCFSDKKLSMQRVFLRKKGEEPPPVTPPPEAEDSTEEPEKETESGGGSEKDRETELEPSSGTAEKEKEPCSETAEKDQKQAGDAKTDSAPAEGGSDVEMTPAEGSGTQKAQNSDSEPPSNSDKP